MSVSGWYRDGILPVPLKLIIQNAGGFYMTYFHLHSLIVSAFGFASPHIAEQTALAKLHLCQAQFEDCPYHT